MATKPREQGIHSQCGNRSISGYIDISRSVFWHAHPTTIRMLLGLSSLLFALSMVTQPGIMSLPQYTIMLAIMPEWLWVAGLVAHFLGVFWRVFDRIARVRWALAINVLGCYLWFAITISVNMSLGLFLPGSSLETITCVFAAWALIRTGIGKDVGTP